MTINKVCAYVISDKSTGEIVETKSIVTAVMVIKEMMADCHLIEVDYKSKETEVEERYESPRLVVDADGIYHYE